MHWKVTRHICVVWALALTTFHARLKMKFEFEKDGLTGPEEKLFPQVKKICCQFAVEKWHHSKLVPTLESPHLRLNTRHMVFFILYIRNFENWIVVSVLGFTSGLAFCDFNSWNERTFVNWQKPSNQRTFPVTVNFGTWNGHSPCKSIS